MSDTQKITHHMNLDTLTEHMGLTGEDEAHTAAAHMRDILTEHHAGKHLSDLTEADWQAAYAQWTGQA